MKKINHKISMIISILVLGLNLNIKPAKSQAVMELGRNLNTNNITVQGRSGGSIDSKGCGFISKKPNQIINITSRIDYLRLSVKAKGGNPTLLIDGPDGRFCSLSDNGTGMIPEISGVWLPGKYSIYIGDRTGDRQDFTLNISQDK